MKSKKTMVIAGAAAVCVAAGGFLIVPRVVNAAGSKDVTVSATQVRSGDLRNYISVTGTVESNNKTYIYAELDEKVEKVHVELGDAVTEGQLLCELDSEDIQESIDEQKATMSLSEQQGYNQIKEAQRAYSDAQSNLKNSTNSQINSAESSLKNAETELAAKQKEYDEKLAEHSARSSAALQSAERAVADTESELESKTKAHSENIELLAVGAISQADLDASQKALETAQSDYDEALDSLADAEETLADELESAKDALVSAETAYQNAEQSLTTASTSVQQELVKYRQSIESAQLSANNDEQVFALERLERQLEQTQVKATAPGTVTGIYATEGVAASGLLFVIEDTDSLKIVTSIKEYNLSKTTVGLPAEIESDATGDELYTGELAMVAPTSKKDTSGNAVSSTDVDFEAEVSVEGGTDLKIGSNARVDLIYEQRGGVMYVPVESVAEGMGEGASSYVYVLTPQNSGQSVEIDPAETRAPGGEGTAQGENAAQGEAPAALGGGAQRQMPAAQADPDAEYSVSKVEVATGIETDLYIEVSGDGLRPGLMVVSSPAMVNEGDSVKIGLNNSGFSGAAAGAGGMGGGMMGGGPTMRMGG